MDQREITEVELQAFRPFPGTHVSLSPMWIRGKGVLRQLSSNAL